MGEDPSSSAVVVASSAATPQSSFQRCRPQAGVVDAIIVKDGALHCGCPDHWGVDCAPEYAQSGATIAIGDNDPRRVVGEFVHVTPGVHLGKVTITDEVLSRLAP